MHFIFKLSHVSHVANGTIPFQVKDWSRMLAHLLLHLFLWKTYKTQLDVLLGLLASYYEGQKARPLVNSNVSSTNIWCKSSHCCRSLSYDWMSLDSFGQADELFLLCWSHCLCMNYASRFGTDESAWDKQWWNLRPSPTVQADKLPVKLATFLGLLVIL